MTIQTNIERMRRGPVMASGPSRVFSEETIDRFHHGFAKSFHANPAMFHWIERQDLDTPGTHIALATHEGVVHAGFLYRFGSHEAGTNVRIVGLFNSGVYSGLGQRLIAHTIVAERLRRGEPLGASAVVRVLPDGTVNAASATCLGRLGFFPVQVLLERIVGDCKDQHLFDTAEPDGQHYRCLELRAKSSDLDAAARSVLARGKDGVSRHG